MKNEKIVLVLFFVLLIGSSLNAQSFSFGMFADVHYAAIPDNGTRKYSQSLEKLKQCIDTMNQKKVKFLVELGDFKDMPTPPDSNAALGFLQKIESEFARFPGDRYHVLGNHDEDCISKKQFYSIARNSGISPEKTYYSFQKGGYRFVVLDACFDSTGNAYDKGNFIWSDANIPSEELKWLGAELKNSKFPVIVFVHQPLNGNTRVSVRNGNIVRSILEKSHKVKCVFQGHEHKGGYEEINGIHYYTLKGLIEGDFPASNSFAIVSLTKDHIFIKGYGTAVSLNL
jgi:alkaline phosphatase